MNLLRPLLALLGALFCCLLRATCAVVRRCRHRTDDLLRRVLPARRPVRAAFALLLLAVIGILFPLCCPRSARATAFVPTYPTPVGPGSRGSVVSWMDANNNNSSVTFVGGSQADGVKVSAWGRFAQATSGSQPLYSLHGGPNGEGCLMFTTQNMTCAQADSVLTAAIGTGKSYSLTFVVRFWAGSLSGVNVSIWNQGGTPVADQAANILVNNTSLKRYNSVTFGSAMIAQRWTLIHYTYNSGSGTEKLYIGGQLAASSTGGATRETFNTGSAWTIGSSSSLYYSQIVVDNTDLSLAQIQSDAAYWHSRFCGGGSTMPTELVFLGDSRTVGVDTSRWNGANDVSQQSYPFILQAKLGPNFVVERYLNLAVGGTQAVQAGNNGVTQSLNGFNPLYRQVIVVWFGYNSWNLAVSEAQAWADIQTLVNQLIDLGAAVVVCTEIDAKNSSVWQTYRNTYNASITSTYPNTPGTYYLCDLGSATHLGALGDSTNLAYFDQDQVHLFGASLSNQSVWSGGYYVVANTVLPVVQQALTALTGVNASAVIGPTRKVQ